MKKTLILAAIAVLAMGVVTSCATKGDTTTPDKETLEDINADATQPAYDEPTNQADVQDVVKLDNDNAIRPDTKVDKITVLDFNATWCGPCKQLTPVFDQAAKAFANKAEFVSVDIDANPQTATAFGVEAVPTVVIMTPDGKTQRYVGTEQLLPYEAFENIINGLLK